MDISQLNTKPGKRATGREAERILASHEVAADSKRALRKLMPWDEGGIAGAVVFVVNGNRHILELSKCSAQRQEEFALHGASQKIGDAAALDKGATTAAKESAVVEMIDQMLHGEWLRGRSTAGGTDLALALSRIKGVSVEAATEAIGRQTDEQLTAWRKHPLVAQELIRIKGERAARAAESATADDLKL